MSDNETEECQDEGKKTKKKRRHKKLIEEDSSDASNRSTTRINSRNIRDPKRYSLNSAFSDVTSHVPARVSTCFEIVSIFSKIWNDLIIFTQSSASQGRYIVWLKVHKVFPKCFEIYDFFFEKKIVTLVLASNQTVDAYSELELPWSATLPISPPLRSQWQKLLDSGDVIGAINLFPTIWHSLKASTIWILNKQLPAKTKGFFMNIFWTILKHSYK